MRRGHVTPSVLQRRRTDSKDMFVAHELNRSELEVANSTVNGRNTGIENRALTVLISLQPSSYHHHHQQHHTLLKSHNKRV